ncbi:MAG: NotI family restriction endonuclease [Gemmatimonadota bacterium]|nr:NotI family restriction endonuclease [Gemmatimonadota bacterium]
MAERKRIKREYGIGEWYCQLFSALSPEERSVLAKAALKPITEAGQKCYFKDASSLEKCTKKGGICSIRHYEKLLDETVQACEGEDGRLVVLCPNRFLEDGMIFKWVSQELLKDNNPVVLNQINFLRSTVTDKSVGRIDNVLVSAMPDGTLNWCALEIQAVYFSGKARSSEFKALIEDASPLPFPSQPLRPDFRSSAPKRLMPQLQIKVPTLRRWGKKMAVVVDVPFFQSLGPMDQVRDVSNCDIVWFIVDFDTKCNPARIKLADTRYTTLEKAVDGLTAGIPMPLTDFEEQIRKKLSKITCK